MALAVSIFRKVLVQSVNNFGDRFYPKEKSTAWPLLFSIESVTKVVIRLKRKPCFRKVLSNHKTLLVQIFVEGRNLRQTVKRKVEVLSYLDQRVAWLRTDYNMLLETRIWFLRRLSKSRFRDSIQPSVLPRNFQMRIQGHSKNIRKKSSQGCAKENM